LNGPLEVELSAGAVFAGYPSSPSKP